MSKSVYYIFSLLLFSLILCSCSNRGIDQSSMFQGRSHKTKDKGIYDAGMNSKKPISLQIQKEYDKMSKYDTNPKKAARKENKELKKKRLKALKARNKHNKKTHVKVKKTKGRPSGEQ